MKHSSVIGVDYYAFFLFKEVEGSVYRRDNILWRYALEFENRATAKDCPVYVKVRVFCCGGNESDFSSFNIVKKSLLLLFVEVLNFIKVKQYAVGCGKGVKLIYNRTDVRRACTCAVELVEFAVRFTGDNRSKGGFAYA